MTESRKEQILTLLKKYKKLDNSELQNSYFVLLRL